MFGYIIINKGEMKFKEFDVYHSYYCGLCQSLKRLYGKKGQIGLTYDMTFLVMLLSSLYEPDTKEDSVKCMAHPFEKHQVRVNMFSEYAADMNLLFSYYKCVDDWKDDKKLSRLTLACMMKKSSRKVRQKYPEKVRRIDSLMHDLSREEKQGNKDIDRMAGIFGEILGEILAVRDDEWADGLRLMGINLGKFIYILDAYEDIEDDIKNCHYNPLRDRYSNPDFDGEIKMILTMLMSDCCKEFEKLPIIDNVEILRNILYSGVWYRFEKVQEKA